MLFLVGRWLAQIHLMAPGDPSNVARAERGWSEPDRDYNGVNIQGEYEELFCKMATRQRFVHFFLHKLTFLLQVDVSEQSVFFNRKSFRFLRFS